MSVLDNSFERLKRYNLAEIFDPTPAVGKTAEAGAKRETLAAVDDSTMPQLGES